MLHEDRAFPKDELKGKEFTGDAFVHCIFTGCDLKFTSFTDCTFSHCDFSGCHLDITSFVHCVFSESKLSFLNFSTTTIKACDFSSSLLQECVFLQLKGGSTSDRKKFDLQNCRFENAHLSGTAFVLCIL